MISSASEVCVSVYTIVAVHHRNLLSSEVKLEPHSDHFRPQCDRKPAGFGSPTPRVDGVGESNFDSCRPDFHVQRPPDLPLSAIPRPVFGRHRRCQEREATAVEWSKVIAHESRGYIKYIKKIMSL